MIVFPGTLEPTPLILTLGVAYKAPPLHLLQLDVIRDGLYSKFFKVLENRKLPPSGAS